MISPLGLKAGEHDRRRNRDDGMRTRASRVVMFCLSILRASGFVVVVTELRPRPPQPRPIPAHIGRTAMAASNGIREGPPGMVALEFYSGIGGLRVSLEKAGAARKRTAVGGESTERPVGETASFEINSLANSVYEHNFPRCEVTRRSIEHLSAEDLDAAGGGAADVWLLSPPCQPFCRVGNRMDEQDPRSTSFLHLMSLLETAENPPTYFFLENVQGFDGSQSHRLLLETLTVRGFDVEQYLLSPIQLGIPNTRLRYYCLASRRTRSTDGRRKGNIAPIKESLPQNPLLQPDEQTVPLRPLSEFLDSFLTGEAAVPLLLSPKDASHASPSLRFDVVTMCSTQTTTFTKGYGKHAGRAGPVVLLTDDGERRVSEENLGRFPSGLDLGPDGREVRWFSDREMLRLHGFPEGFDFPKGLTQRQRCALIGNSVNVEVVALLLERLIFQGEEVEENAGGLAATV